MTNFYLFTINFDCFTVIYFAWRKDTINSNIWLDTYNCWSVFDLLEDTTYFWLIRNTILTKAQVFIYKDHKSGSSWSNILRVYFHPQLTGSFE